MNEKSKSADDVDDGPWDVDDGPCTHDCTENCEDDLGDYQCYHSHCFDCGECGCAGYCDDYQTYNLRPDETGGQA